MQSNRPISTLFGQCELSNLGNLKEQVDRSKELANNMLNILSSFEERLSKLEDTVLPLYNETKNLQLQQKNVEATVLALDHVIEYYSVGNNVKNTLKEGPSGPDGLDAFLNALERLKQAQNYFEKNNPQCIELENISSLFNNGIDTLNREFKEILLKHSKPIQPMTLLDLISSEDDVTTFTDDSSSVGSLSHFSDSVVSDLTRIAGWLISESRDEFMNVYARVRATTSMKSLTLLKEHQRSGSGSSLQGVASSPTIKSKVQNRIDSINRRTSKKIQSMFERKANRMLMKASQTLEYSTGLSIGSRRSVTHTHFGETREEVIDEQEMENYLMIVLAVQKLIQIELSLLNGIIPVQHQYQVFQIIIQDLMDTIVQEAESLVSRAKKCINRHDFLNALLIFPILKHFFTLKPDFEKIIEKCDLSLRNQFSSVIFLLQSTGAKILEDFVESVRSDSSTSLPKDGTVYQLTSDVLFFLEQLLNYADIMSVIGAVLSQDPSYSSALAAVLSDPKHANVDKNEMLIGVYIKKVLSQLNLTLLNKSDFYNDIGVKGVFRLNNCNYILKTLQRSNLLQLLMLYEPECENAYYNMIATHKKTYQQCWNKLLAHIAMNEDIQIHYGKLKDKDRSLLKEKFSGFNKEIEEISKLQRGYSIPDFELREGLKRDNKEIILPKYNAFYDRYGNLPFATNHEKYVKYTPEQISAFIDRFFDIAA